MNPEESKLLMEIKKKIKQTESAIINKGLRLVDQKDIQKKKTALELAGDSVGKVSSGIKDLSTNKKYFEGFGK
jgi:uncharacterized protein YoxC